MILPLKEYTTLGNLGYGIWDADEMTALIKGAILRTRQSPGLAAEDNVVYIPAGDYFITGMEISDADVRNSAGEGYRCLTIAGAGCGTVLHWARGRGFQYMMRFLGVRHLTISGITFHGEGFAFGDEDLGGILGLMDCASFRVERNRFVDNAQDADASSRSRPALDIVHSSGRVADNYSRYYGVAVGACEGVSITGNTIIDARGSAVEVSPYSPRTETPAVADLRIERNVIEDANTFGISIGLFARRWGSRGRPRLEAGLSDMFGSVKRVSVRDNSIVFTDSAARVAIGGVRVWAGEAASQPPVYERQDANLEPAVTDMVVESNVVVSERSARNAEFDGGNEPGLGQGISVESWVGTGGVPAELRRVSVSRNQIVGFAVRAVEAKNMVVGCVGDNGMFGANEGLSLGANCASVHVHSNRFFGAESSYVLVEPRSVMEGNLSLDGRRPWSGFDVRGDVVPEGGLPAFFVIDERRE